MPKRTKGLASYYTTEGINDVWFIANVRAQMICLTVSILFPSKHKAWSRMHTGGDARAGQGLIKGHNLETPLYKNHMNFGGGREPRQAGAEIKPTALTV